MPGCRQTRLTGGLHFPDQRLTLRPTRCTGGFIQRSVGYRSGNLRHSFDEYLLDTDRRELHREIDAVPVAPQVFDILDYLINRGEACASATIRPASA